MGATRLIVVGQGYVGLALAMRAVEVGFDVVGYDVDGDRIKALAAGDSFVEDVGDDVLRAALDCGRYRPVADLDGIDGFDVAVIAVPTPLREGTPDLSYIDDASLEAVRGFYDRLVDRTVPVSGPMVAELTKLLENTFRHVNIALVNELAMFADDLGIDMWEAIDAASTKPFGYLRFSPGPGVGGHCLPVDPSYLSWQVRRRLGRSFRFVELANDVNDHMPDYVVSRLVVALNRQAKAVKGSRILLLGVSFKRNVGDCREAPSRRITRLLADLGADLRACDPHVAPGDFPPGATPVELSADELAAADMVVALVDHDAFDPAVVVEHSRSVLDTRGWLPIRE